MLATSVALAITAAAATYLVIQLIQGGNLLSLSGVGVSPHNFTLYTTIGLYSLSAVLLTSSALMLKSYCAHEYKKKGGCCEGLIFLRRFCSNPSQVGALAPSSKALAKEISIHIPDRSHESSEEGAKRYLEIGAGSGSFTRKIVKKLGPGDHLDVVEFDANFCKQLQDEFKEYIDNGQVTIHQISITEYQANPYDVIISGLPLNAFKSEFVNKILIKYEELAKEGAYISYFEYIALEKIKKAFLCGSDYTNFCSVLKQKKAFTKKHSATSVRVLGNLPPARVQHCVVKREAVS